MDTIQLSIQFRRKTSDLIYPDHSKEFVKSGQSFRDFAESVVDWLRDLTVFTAHERSSITVRRIRDGETIDEYISPDPEPEIA